MPALAGIRAYRANLLANRLAHDRGAADDDDARRIEPPQLSREGDIDGSHALRREGDRGRSA